MKYEIEIPEGRWCSECLAMVGARCSLLKVELSTETTQPYRAIKDKRCPAYHGEVIRQGLMGRAKP